MKFGTFAISNKPILILMSKTICMKYLLPVRFKLVPKLTMLRIYWNFAHLTVEIILFDFNIKNDLYEIFATQISPKIKIAQNLLKFGTFGI